MSKPTTQDILLFVAFTVVILGFVVFLIIHLERKLREYQKRGR